MMFALQGSGVPVCVYVCSNTNFLMLILFFLRKMPMCLGKIYRRRWFSCPPCIYWNVFVYVIYLSYLVRPRKSKRNKKIMSNIDLSCFSEARQQFLVCITVHKAKNLHILNADTFVLISFDRIHKKTSVYENSDCPYFNEYFVFDTERSLNDLLRQTIVIRVIQRKILCRRNPIIGELFIDLRSIWEAPSKLFPLIYRHIHSFD